MKLSQLTIVGTHDSATYKLKYPLSIFAKTQNLSIEQQLALGVRYFDFRLNLDKDGMQCYHGLIKCNISWKEVLTIFNKFLKDNPFEFVLLRVVRADDNFKRKDITDSQWNWAFQNESKGIIVADRDLEFSEIKGRITVINLNWKIMVPQKMTKGYYYDTCEEDTAKVISEANELVRSDEKLIKLVYLNADGSFKWFNNVKYLNKIPYPRSFFKLLNKKMDKLIIRKGNWYIFDFIDEVKILNKINH